MKRYLLLLAVVLTVFSVSAQDLVVGSYNIRNSNSGDTKNGNGWERRCPVICDQVEWVGFDVFGMQEVKHNQLEDMLNGLPDYDYEGVGRDDGKQAGEYSPIFYKKERFKYLEGGTFWISETPEKVGVKGWDAALPRICSYVHLQDKVTKKRFWFFNLHMDHVGVEARREGAKLIAKKITEMCGKEPAFVTGDFNVVSTDKALDGVRDFMRNARTYATVKDNNPTINGFGASSSRKQIDHIYYSDYLKAVEYYTIMDAYNGVTYVSDHYPIYAIIKLKK